MNIQLSLFDYFMDDDSFTTKEAEMYVTNIKGVNKESVRARIYEGVEKGIFTKISRGVYKVESQLKDVKCILINGDGRDLSLLKNNSIDGIVTDHPYLLSKSLKGGNRNFATYELFRYELNDFIEKQRVLKKGAFLVEFLPQENEQNFEYLYQIKKMAIEAGFKYFAMVPWIKGTFVSNTGRQSHNCEMVMIFSNGEPRELKLDAKKNLSVLKEHGIPFKKGISSYEVRDILEQQNLTVHYMKGTNGMLPTEFNFQPRAKKDKIMEAEKPVELLEDIIGYITRPYETILDQFGGSMNLAIASYNTDRNSIIIEKDPNIFRKGKDNVLSNINGGKLVVMNDKEYNYGPSLKEQGKLDISVFLQMDWDSRVEYFEEILFDTSPVTMPNYMPYFGDNWKIRDLFAVILDNDLEDFMLFNNMEFKINIFYEGIGIDDDWFIVNVSDGSYVDEGVEIGNVMIRQGDMYYKSCVFVGYDGVHTDYAFSFDTMQISSEMEWNNFVNNCADVPRYVRENEL